MAGTDYKFQGWIAKDKNAIGNMVWGEYTPKTWTEDDVDIQITHCGICASDLHTLRSGWGATDYDAVVGHEIVGKVVKVGKNVKDIKLGDRVGVGAQSGSCLSCTYCEKGHENYCNKGQVGTYNGRYSDKSKSFGGYADYARLPAHFAFKIPDGIPSEIAAPLMCGGATLYSPLKQLEAGPGKRIGIVGIGGLGHFGLLFAKALGAEPVAISHSHGKEEDAKKMGAVEFIATKDDGYEKKFFRTLDGIVCTINDEAALEESLPKFAALVKPGGKIILVGIPEKPLQNFKVTPLVMGNTFLGGSAIAGSVEIKEMLALVAKVNLKAWVVLRDLKDANQAVVDMEDSKARYRYVLVNTKNGGKL